MGSCHSSQTRSRTRLQHSEPQPQSHSLQQCSESLQSDGSQHSQPQPHSEPQQSHSLQQRSESLQSNGPQHHSEGYSEPQQSYVPQQPSEPQPVRPRVLNVQFRVLIIGRANAGKTTILRRVCDTTDSPEIYRHDPESGIRYRVRSHSSWCHFRSHHPARSNSIQQPRLASPILGREG
jgi:hypothetical protein